MAIMNRACLGPVVADEFDLNLPDRETEVGLDLIKDLGWYLVQQSLAQCLRYVAHGSRLFASRMQMVLHRGVVASRGAEPGQFHGQPRAAERLERVVYGGKTDAGDLLAHQAENLICSRMAGRGTQGLINGAPFARTAKTAVREIGLYLAGVDVRNPCCWRMPARTSKV